MKNFFRPFIIGFAACLVALSVVAAVTRVTVVKNSSSQIFFTDPIICTNSFTVRTNLVLIDTRPSYAGGSFILTCSNGAAVLTTNTSNIGL